MKLTGHHDKQSDSFQLAGIHLHFPFLVVSSPGFADIYDALSGKFLYTYECEYEIACVASDGRHAVICTKVDDLSYRISRLVVNEHEDDRDLNALLKGAKESILVDLIKRFLKYV